MASFDALGNSDFEFYPASGAKDLKALGDL
jgi:hypothetical protein